jgi:hypothetical protein
MYWVSVWVFRFGFSFLGWVGFGLLGLDDFHDCFTLYILPRRGVLGNF